MHFLVVECSEDERTPDTRKHVKSKSLVVNINTVFRLNKSQIATENDTDERKRIYIF